MENFDYYSDRKFCPTCNDYVPYLMSVEHSFCIECGGRVKLFSKDDWQSFHESLSAKRPKAAARAKTRTKSPPNQAFPRDRL